MTPLFMLNGDTEMDESGADENEVLAEASGMIPICITGIHEFWRKPSDAGPESRSRPGRRRRRLQLAFNSLVSPTEITAGDCANKACRASAPLSVLWNVGIGTSVGSEKPVPKGVDHSEIAARVQMVDEVKLLLAPEPSETG
jgi:hypothetical protein